MPSLNRSSPPISAVGRGIDLNSTSLVIIVLMPRFLRVSVAIDALSSPPPNKIKVNGGVYAKYFM
jgi:hypothetical protein